MRITDSIHRFFFLNTTSANARKALVIFIIGILFTVIATFYTKYNVEAETYRDFKLICNDLKISILSRLYAHAQLLRCGSAFFTASDTVTRKEWSEFYEHAKISNNLPGIQGIGFSYIIPKNNLQQHIREIRKQGFPDYTVKPAGDRNIYTSIIYIEPFSGRNLRAFGYDMFSEPVRRKAMEFACDSDVATLSGKVILVQETNEDIQAGTLMYVPVYRNGMPVNTVEQRRVAIKGWVYSPYRMNDLMQGILGRWDVNWHDRIHLQIYDDECITVNSLLFDSQRNDALSHNDLLSRTISLPIEFYGKKWILYFSQSVEQLPFFQDKVLIVLLCGIAISLLLFFLSLSLFNTRYSALQIAEQLTSELKESEARFKNMFMRHNSIMLLVEPEKGTIINANVAASEFYGYSIPELCAMSVDDISSSTTGQTSDERIKANDKKQNYFIFTHKLADGKKRIVEVHSSPITYAGKSILFSIIHDITERKHAEQALRDNEEKLRLAYLYARSLIEASLDPLVTINVDGKITDVNTATEKATGLSRDYLVGTDFSEYFTEPDKARIGYQKVFEQGYVIDYPLTIRHLSGKLTDVLYNASVYRDEQGRILGIFAAARDITEREHAEQALRDNEEKLRLAYLYARSLIEASLDPLVTINVDGKITDVNTATEKATGLSRDYLVGTDFSEYFTEPDKARIGYQKVFEQGYVIDYPLTIRHLSGKLTDVLYNASVYRDEQGKILGIFAAARDITIRKQAEEKLKANETILKELNADKDRFISILAHDLKSPFNSILGFLELLNSNIRRYDIDKIADLLKIVYNSAQHTFNLLDDLLSWVRVQSGKIPYEPQVLNFSIVCAEVVESMKLNANDKNITINYLSSGRLNVFADKNMLKTTLRNLVSNAIKFTNKGGHVNIYTEQSRAYVTITVSDNGVGIKPEMITKLFDISQFYTTEGTENEKGTGLGLLLCKDFVEKHGGKIWVDSKIEKGSDFKFTIPVFIEQNNEVTD